MTLEAKPECPEEAERFWDIAGLLDTDVMQGEVQCGLVSIVLNRPLSEMGFEFVKRSEIVICADGGANRLHTMMMMQQQEGVAGAERLLASLPSVLKKRFLVVGDFDSIHSESLQRFRRLGNSIQITPSDDPNSTDLEKSIMALQSQFSSVLLQHDRPSLIEIKPTSESSESSHGVVTPAKPAQVAVFGAFGGSLHHVLANIHVMFRSIESSTEIPTEEKEIMGLNPGKLEQSHDTYGILKLPSLQLYLSGEGSICCLLGPGRHRLRLDSKRSLGACGLLPLGNSIRSISTSGLQWNLNSSEMKLGGLISSSNQVVSPIVEVTTSDAVLFTLDINEAVDISEELHLAGQEKYDSFSIKQATERV